VKTVKEKACQENGKNPAWVRLVLKYLSNQKPKKRKTIPEGSK